MQRLEVLKPKSTRQPFIQLLLQNALKWSELNTTLDSQFEKLNELHQVFSTKVYIRKGGNCSKIWDHAIKFEKDTRFRIKTLRETTEQLISLVELHVSDDISSHPC